MDRVTRKAQSPVNYAESEASSNPTTFETPPGQQLIDLDQDELQDGDWDEDSTIQCAPVPRRGLRERKSTLKASENDQLPQQQNQTPSDTESIDKLAGGDLTPVINSRTAIRQEIAIKTTAYRERFLIEKKDLWLPLLPQNNYIQKLVEKQNQLSADHIARLRPVSPYEEIETQPHGVTATMKPYQLSGLSFLVYLHRNGLGGILGDEMGLGKTLQTLSLIQYLKENDPKGGKGRHQRPCLVICPLSVLSSWIAEARKWTPKLKVIRFHGPDRERIRLKKVVAGDIDLRGNVTAQAKSKHKTRRRAAGKVVINLDTDSEDEADVGVDLVVTTYECYRAEHSWFKKAFIWRWAILDEGHAVLFSPLFTYFS